MWIELNNILYLLMGLLLASINGLLCWCLFIRNKRQSQEIGSLNRALESLRADLERVNTGAIGVGRRLIRVEKRLVSTIDKQQTLEGRELASITYQSAVRLLREGAEVKEVVKSCGVSHTEAQLVKLLQTARA